VVSRTGRVRVIDLALGPGTLAAMTAGLIPVPSSLAPELAAGAPPSSTSDVYAVGALLYEALVGTPLERGGPRPSDVVKDVNTQIDEVVARACHRDAEKRFGRVEVLGEVVAEALETVPR
jgi:serine/threonine protein kinase